MLRILGRCAVRRVFATEAQTRSSAVLVSKLQNPGNGRTPRPQGEVSVLREPVAGEARDGAAATPPKVAKATGGDPVALCLYSMNFGEAPCVGIVGDRGTGKSRAMRALVAGWLSRDPGVVLALDKGGASGFEGQRRVSLSDLRLHPMAPSPRAVVFTGDLGAGLDPDAEGVARFAWQLRASRTNTLLAVDELKWAAKNGWWRKGVHWLPQSCSEGRKHHVGVLWGSQSPQDAPREAFEECDPLVVFRLAGLGLDRLRDRGYLVGIPDLTIERLPGDDSPPDERGRCLILRRGRPWNRKFYRFG